MARTEIGGYCPITRKASRGIPWGWKRSLGEHLKIGRSVGLTPKRCFTANKDFELLKEIKVNKATSLPARGDIVLVEFIRNRQMRGRLL